MIENILMKLSKEFNLYEKVELVEYIESLMYDEDSLTIYPVLESDSEVSNYSQLFNNYLSRLENGDEFEEFEETHFLDIIRSLVCTYESNNDELSQVQLFVKLFNYFNN